METMMAHFNDAEARDKAVAAAQKQGVQVTWVGDISPAPDRDGNPSGVAPRPFVLFRGSMLDGLVFMQHGAGSCGAA